MAETLKKNNVLEVTLKEGLGKQAGKEEIKW